MIEKVGDFWKESKLGYDALVVTINTVVRSDGRLVMGKGIAKDFADVFPLLPKRLGDLVWQFPLINRDKPNGPRKNPGPLFIKYDGENIQNSANIIALPTKLDWREPSPYYLIKENLNWLALMADDLKLSKILMTRPGCGNGGLNWDTQVKPIAAELLDDRFAVISSS